MRKSEMRCCRSAPLSQLGHVTRSVTASRRIAMGPPAWSRRATFVPRSERLGPKDRALPRGLRESVDVSASR